MSREKLTILFLSKQHSLFARFSDTLAADDRFALAHGDSAGFGLEAAGARNVDIVVVAEELKDSSGLDFAKRLVLFNPLVNCALVSPLYPQEFHEQTEGLGLLMQLPLNPQKEDAERLVDVLEKIYPALAQ
jgi:hypothetical protein